MTMTDTKLTFNIDVDGVIRDMVPKMVECYNEVFDEKMSYADVADYNVDISFPKAYEKYGSAAKFFFGMCGAEVYLDSKACMFAKEAMTLLSDCGIVNIVTKQPSARNKMTTVQWLDEKGIKYDNLMFVRNDKSSLPCDVFVDDHDRNFYGCGGQLGVLIDAPYNRNVDLDDLKSHTDFQRIVRCNSLYDFARNIEGLI